MLFNSIQSAQNGDQNEMLYLISRFQVTVKAGSGWTDMGQ